MYKRFLTIAASGTLMIGLACGLQAYAQTDSGAPQDSNAQANPQGPHGPMHHGGRMSADEQLERMSKMLNLTDDQKSQIKPILEDTHQQMRSIHTDTSLSPQDKRAKMHSLMADMHAKIRAVLTEEQRAKLDQMQQRRREHMRKPPGGPSQ
ncbi:MAG TPA: Spy/CpxP family protein refolding chaperone [Terriglobia bacterium]|nr:Spy/CpxP family protein refolding chaperone [Terriglobia bacterium]